MDAYARVFKMKGLNNDTAQRSLYLKILKFRDILNEKVEIAGKTIKKHTVEISANKLFNIGAVVLALGLIATVISSANKGLQKQAEKTNSKL